MDVKDETPEGLGTDDSAETGSRLQSENDSENVQNVSHVSDCCDTVTSPVRDLESVDQSDVNQIISHSVPEIERRSQKMRTVPKRFTYDTLGMPTVEPVAVQTKAVNPVRYHSSVYL